MKSEQHLETLLSQRFGATDGTDLVLAETPAISQLASRGSCRAFRDQAPDLALVKSLCALALCAPSKSDLQQRDILIVEDSEKTSLLRDLLGRQEWIAGAPRFLLFLANNRRQRQVQEMHDEPFPNDHLDAFFNASLDAGIALAYFMTAAEATGLGCCPVSTIRDHLREVAKLFALPDHVFPVAALALGYPAQSPRVSPRLSLRNTVHLDHFRETPAEDIRAYDLRRSQETGGPAWSQAKARMYATPQRQDFAEFAKSIGFKLS